MKTLLCASTYLSDLPNVKAHVFGGELNISFVWKSLVAVVCVCVCVCD